MSTELGPVGGSAQNEQCGLALLCRVDGVIEKVLLDQVPLANDAAVGSHFRALVTAECEEKADRFLREISSRKSAFGWELQVRSGRTARPLHFGGSSSGTSLLIVAARSTAELTKVYEDVNSVDDASVDDFRALLRERSIDEASTSFRPLDIYDDLTRLNNELANSQRELARRSAELERTIAENSRLYDEAQRANRGKDDFIATLAHELRSPMTAIRGWIQMLQNHNLNEEETKTAIDMIENSAEVQARLVDDLFDMSRINTSKLRLDLRRVELSSIVSTVATTFRPSIVASGLRFTVDARDTELQVLADPGRIQQVVWNLLSNAMKFTPGDGHVRLAVYRSGGDAAIEVGDSGIGIDPAFLPHVFERFQQAESATEEYGGLGLGLAIVRNLVELHRGTVSAFSGGEGTGATFVVRLPLVPTTAQLPESSEGTDSRL